MKKAYPRLTGMTVLFQFNMTAQSDTFWSLVTFIHTQISLIYGLKRQASSRAFSSSLTPLSKDGFTSDWFIDPIYGGFAPPELFTSFMETWPKLSAPLLVGTDTRLGLAAQQARTDKGS